VSDGWNALSAVGAACGGVGGLAAVWQAIRAASSRRHVERARDAKALLEALDTLPDEHVHGSRVQLGADSADLRGELSRIVRENAASYAQQHPTPVGIDFARVIVPAYAAMFVVFGVITLFDAAGQADSNEAAVSRVVAGFWLLVAFGFVAAAGFLHARMSRRNLARQLAGTPGREYYFGPLVDLWRSVRTSVERRRAMRRASRADPTGQILDVARRPSSTAAVWACAGHRSIHAGWWSAVAHPWTRANALAAVRLVAASPVGISARSQSIRSQVITIASCTLTGAPRGGWRHPERSARACTRPAVPAVRAAGRV
jgi:hypothetical protein